MLVYYVTAWVVMGLVVSFTVYTTGSAMPILLMIFPAYIKIKGRVNE